RLGFPGRLAFLGGGRDGDGPVGGQLIEAAAELAARQPALAQHGVDAAMAARVLRAILIDRRAPTDLLADQSLQAAALEAAAHVLASHGVGVSPDDARTALRLLTTGEFFGDVASTTATVVRFVPTLPLEIGRDIPRMPFHL